MRICSKCANFMTSGYVIEDGLHYFCSDKCLFSVMTKEEYDSLFDEGDGNSYWTEWEPECLDCGEIVNNGKMFYSGGAIELYCNKCFLEHSSSGDLDELMEQDKLISIYNGEILFPFDTN